MINPNYKLVISPMAGVTDAPFRHIAIQNGADYGISEMITSQTHLWDSQKTQNRLRIETGDNTKRIIQIAGTNPNEIATAAKLCADSGAEAIEINMGCPAKKVCNVLAGSALLKDEALVANILHAAVKAVPIPIYLKTRLGWDQQNKNILTIANIAEDAGISSLAIHGRTRADMYNGEASFELIAQVKHCLTIPVFANGDITTVQIAKQVLDYTSADGLYIGRGSLGQPWLFQQIRDYIATGSMQSYTDDQIKHIIIQHITSIHQHYGDYMGVRFARKHMKWYMAANPDLFEHGHHVFSQFAQLDLPTTQLELIAKWFKI